MLSRRARGVGSRNLLQTELGAIRGGLYLFVWDPVESIVYCVANARGLMDMGRS